MRKLVARWLLVLTLLVAAVTPGYARDGHSGGHGGFHGGHGGFRGGHGGFHGGVFVGGPWWWGGPWWGPYGYPYGYGYYAPYGYYPPYGAYPPAVIEQGPSVYMQQPQAQSQPQGYWYYCASAKGYYPDVKKCPEAWIKVPPAPQ